MCFQLDYFPTSSCLLSLSELSTSWEQTPDFRFPPRSPPPSFPAYGLCMIHTHTHTHTHNGIPVHCVWGGSGHLSGSGLVQLGKAVALWHSAKDCMSVFPSPQMQTLSCQCDGCGEGSWGGDEVMKLTGE